MGCLWMVIRTATMCLAKSLSVSAARLHADLLGRKHWPAVFPDSLTGLSTLYKGLVLWTCFIQVFNR